MSQEITTAMVNQYKQNIDLLSQQKGSRLRNAVTVEVVNGEYAYFEQREEHGQEEHGLGGHGEVVRDEAPLSMLIPILIMAAGILALGPFSGKIISSIIQFAVPAGL